MGRVLRIGVDTGGTFTDLLAVCTDGRLMAVKLPSTPADPGQAVLAGLDRLLPPVAEGGPGDAVPVAVGAGERSGRVLTAEASGSIRASEPSGGLRLPGPPPPRAEVVHGTTVGTNALLERKGGPTALCVTAGFEDLLILGRQA